MTADAERAGTADEQGRRDTERMTTDTGESRGTDTTNEANAFLMGSGGRSAKFTQHEDEVDGSIISLETRQQTDFDSNALLFWDDGKPRMQLVVTISVAVEPEDQDDDLIRKLYVRGQMTQAVRKAVLDVGERGLAVNGRLFVRYVADGEPKRAGMSGAKQYIAKYQPPVVAVPDEPDVYDDAPLPDDLPF